MYCANKKMDSATIQNRNVTPTKLAEDRNVFGNNSKPPSIKCMPACERQDNAIQMSIVNFPQKENFLYKKKFCHVASHIWQVTCQDEERKHFLDMKQPELCKILQTFEEYFGHNSTCKQWPKNFLDGNIN